MFNIKKTIILASNGKTLAEISTEEKFLISPRKKALEKIEEYIMNGNL